jgi:alpha-L-arabinofuranosidase
MTHLFRNLKAELIGKEFTLIDIIEDENDVHQDVVVIETEEGMKVSILIRDLKRLQIKDTDTTLLSVLIDDDNDKELFETVKFLSIVENNWSRNTFEVEVTW